MDELDKKIYEEIQSRKENKEPYENLFNKLFQIELSNCEARKELRGIENYLDFKRENNMQITDSENMPKYNETIELMQDGSYKSDKLLKMNSEQSKDPNYLLQAHGFDEKHWQILSAKNNIWNVYSKQDGVQQLYSSKISVKPIEEYRWNTEDIDRIFESFNKVHINNTIVKSKQYENNGKILIVPIADFHLGLLSDKYSNGNDYNLEIAENLFNEVIDDVLYNNINKKFEKVLFIIGNDSTNSDNLSSTTAHGTPQDDCALWFTIVETITRLYKEAIEKLKVIAPVDVLLVPSNHDLHTMYGVCKTLEAWFRNDKDIHFDSSPLPRKYYSYGTTTLAFSHDVKVKDALKIVSTEARDKWSNSKRVIFILAHLHQAMEYEKQGMLEIRRLPTISGFSRWSNGKGYVQNERKNQAFILDYNKGIVDIQNTILDI